MYLVNAANEATPMKPSEIIEVAIRGLHGLPRPAPPRPAPRVPQPAGRAGLPAKGLLRVRGGCGLDYFGAGCGAGYPHITAGRGGAVRRQLRAGCGLYLVDQKPALTYI